MSSDLLPLIEDLEPLREALPPWQILIVDDDDEVHVVTRLALDDFHFEGRPVQIISAYSDASARQLMSDNPDIALILLDVVMESDHAGLELVHFVRDRLKNNMVRIVLRTGQPGQAPPRDVIQNYGIDDYRTKTELTFERLFVVVTSALRTYHLLSSMAEQQRRIAHQATHDDLTGLPNRTLLYDRIGQALALARRGGSQLALLFLDLDGFKFINDSFGHTLGDSLLKAVAERMRIDIRQADTVARLGGDEFVVMLGNVQSPDDAIVAAQKILQSLAEPFHVDGRSLMVTGSIGVSLYPRDGDNAEALLKNADVALYGAKQLGRNRSLSYYSELSATTDERVELEGALRRALQLNQFELHYQPRQEISDGRISGVEALLRWRHPQLGMVAPSRFIPLAEEVGLIGAIGRWVLQTACHQLRAWHDAGFSELTMAVNMSPSQFHDLDFLDFVRNSVQQSGLHPEQLELEITESSLIRNPERAVRMLHELKEVGVQLSMDDFGTGYSSLSYLNRLPVDIIKIDRSFTCQLGDSDEAASITRAIIALARFLKMRTICEGVETAEQLEFLRENGCDSIQGFYFSPGLPANELLQLLLKTAAGSMPQES